MAEDLKLFTNKELCEKLTITSRTLQNYRDKGYLEFIQIGKKIYYTQEALENFLDSFKIKAKNPKL